MERSLINHFIFSEIANVVGEENATLRSVDRLTYAQDYYWVGQMWIDRKEKPCYPDIIAYPANSEEIQKLVKIAVRHKIPVIPYGGGSGTQGGIIPLYGGLVIDVKRMNKIIKIDKESMTMIVQPGANVMQLEKELNQQGLTWPHYPASAPMASVGGCVAARGTGTISTKYGKAEDMVLSMEVVVPSGEIIRTLPTPSHACGSSLLQLFIGSEGTLGVITELRIRISKIPKVRRFNAYLFENLKDALDAGRDIMVNRLLPCTLRLYDPPSTAKFLKGVLGMDLEGSVLITGCDGDEDTVSLEEKKIEEFCFAYKAKELGSKAGDTWWKNRYKFYFPPYAPCLPTMYGTFESTTTFDCIYSLYQNKKRTIEGQFQEYGTKYTGHFSHWYPWGTMVYDRFYIENPPQDAHKALLLHNKIWGVAIKTNIESGGTLNDHHGVGLKLGWLMPEQYGAGWDTMVAIKDAIDPYGIMNPGKLGFGPIKK